MIFGVGIDIVETARIKKIIEKYDTLFLQKIFTEFELKEGFAKKDPVTYFAGRWAAKEALSKALGVGIGEKCSWLEIEIQSQAHGNPICLLSGNAEKTATEISIIRIHLSITHEKEYAGAVVALECE